MHPPAALGRGQPSPSRAKHKGRHHIPLEPHLQWQKPPSPHGDPHPQHPTCSRKIPLSSSPPGTPNGESPVATQTCSAGSLQKSLSAFPCFALTSLVRPSLVNAGSGRFLELGMICLLGVLRWPCTIPGVIVPKLFEGVADRSSGRV